MIRRLPLLAAAVAVTAALPACSTFDDVPATVNGHDIGAGAYQRGVEALDGAPEDVIAQLGLAQLPDSGVDGGTARVWLGYLINKEIESEVLARAGGSVTDEDRTAAESDVSGNDALNGLDAAVRSVVVERLATFNAIQRVMTAPSAEQIAAQYATTPAGTGALCLRHIVVPTRSEALEILRELRAGADFATLAAARSHEQLATQTGGALEDQGSACYSVQAMSQRFDADFVNGALTAKAEVPTEPVPSQFGWHVILARPYQEVADDLVALVTSAPDAAAVYGAYVTAKVRVASKFGRWDPASASVVPAR